MAWAFNSGTSASVPETSLKAAADSVITQANNVAASSDVDIIWKYADHLWEKQRYSEARTYLEAGLSFAPFNYLYQARLAVILAKSGSHAAAIDRARVVYEKSEDEEPIRLVLEILGKKAVEAFKPIEKTDFASPTVVLVTIGKVEKLLVQELQQKIAAYLDIPVVIFSENSVAPAADRSRYLSEISKMRGNILSLPDVVEYLQKNKIEVESLQTDNELFVTTLAGFLKQKDPAAAEEFKKNMEIARKLDQQWKYDNLRDYLIEMVKPCKGTNWFVVGVTEYDLYMENTNYVFAGTNPYAQAIMSYHRFKADFNHEPQNRRRLAGRLFKQFLSVFGLLNGMVRCTFPDCARVFPRSLTEHDEKPEFLCNECRQTLARLLKINIKSPSGSQ